MRIILIALVAFMTTGCSVFNTAGSDKASCPGMPKGVTCKPPREVYAMTDRDKKVKAGGGYVPTYIFASQPNEASLSPQPIVEQAKVMRVWIAAWTDSNNDLHWPGLAFTVLQPKQWHFGQEDFNGVEPPVPHRMIEAAPAKTDSATGSAEMPKID